LVGWWNTVLPGSADRFTVWRTRGRVDICRVSACIYRVVGKLQLDKAIRIVVGSTIKGDMIYVLARS
jgi:hypothetical protein